MRKRRRQLSQQGCPLPAAREAVSFSRGSPSPAQLPNVDANVELDTVTGPSNSQDSREISQSCNIVLDRRY